MRIALGYWRGARNFDGLDGILGMKVYGGVSTELRVLCASLYLILGTFMCQFV